MGIGGRRRLKPAATGEEKKRVEKRSAEKRSEE
jgi:hypothetical protein